MTLLFFEGIILGFLAHQIRPLLDAFPRGPRDWISYVLGVVSTWPTAMRIYDNIDADSCPPRIRFSLAYFIAFVAVGIGVILGWIFEIVMLPIEDDEENGEGEG